MLLRLIERAGMAAAMSCTVALPLSLLLGWRGSDATEPALLCITLGLLAGIAWGATELPTILEAAMEADRQLQWADLLGSAWLLRARPDDPWRRMVLNDADRRCRGLSPSSIFLRRLTPRTWSGIVLALTLTLALSAWIGSPAASLAHDARPAGDVGSTQTPDRGDRPLLAPIPLGMRPSAAPPDGQDAASDRATPPVPDRADNTTAASRSGDVPDLKAASSDGQGGALGRTNPRFPDHESPRVGDTPGETPSVGGKLPGGNAPSSADGTIGAQTSGGAVSSTLKQAPENVPWTMQSWPGAADAAQQAVAAGRVPPACRDLIREYFQRN
jgi:hypothetical protein